MNAHRTALLLISAMLACIMAYAMFYIFSTSPMRAAVYLMYVTTMLGMSIVDDMQDVI